jgi:uracil-DNA glycosylase family 4
MSCDGCLLHRNRFKTISGKGNKHARLFFVLAQISESAVREGEIVDGPVKRFLEKTLSYNGVDLDEVWISPTTACPPARRQKLAKVHIDECRPRLQKEIHLVQPDLIIALGTKACEALFTGQSRPSVAEFEGRIVETVVQGDVIEYTYPVLITESPTMLLRKPDRRPSGSWNRFFEQIKFGVKVLRYMDHVNTKKTRFSKVIKGS